MTSTLPSTFTISRAGTSMINGLYSLDTKSPDIKYVQTITHPCSNKRLIVEIIKTKIPALDSKQTYFLIQARAQNTKLIHYYASKSLFTSSSQQWETIAGIHPVPNIAIPPKEFNKMLPAQNTQEEKQEKEEKQSDISHIKPTIRTFLTDTYLFEREGVVVYADRDSKRGEYIILDDSIFHPQGGGQPTDTGYIQNVDGTVRFNVEFVANHPIKHSCICHYGSYASGNAFNMNEKVMQSINASDRVIFAQLHTGGHIIDIGMGIIGKLLNIVFTPVKGYHFAKGAYVEYGGDIPIDKRSEMKDLLQKELDELIGNNQSVRTVTKVVACEEYLENVACIKDRKEQDEHLRKMKVGRESKVRVVDIPGFPDAMCMCGGTHVDGINRIKRVVVTKFKKKSRNFRVSYKVE